MTFNPGRNAGRVSIRVVPDTTRFRRELKRSLGIIEKNTRMTVTVNSVNLDRAKISEDIRRQVEGLRHFAIDADVDVTVDKARLKKVALRKSIQDQFDTFENIRVDIQAAIKNAEHFERDVKRMVDRASRNKVNIAAAASTAAAAAQLRYVSRPRWVEIFVKINKKSLVTVTSTLAALSGARLSWKWIDDLVQQIKELDRNLPKLLGWTTGLTSLTAAVFAGTSGLVGIGQGLFSILPAFLVLPGLILNAGGSVTALIVALKNAGTELDVLKDDMTELGDIINDTFWGRARKPIVDLVKGLMPQLRTSFRDLSEGIGDFTAAMAYSFGKELSNGRLASIFNGIAEGWRVLATGADGFAGALVSLSNIAAQYTPRLAGWFVRQANTFDTWLKAISEDGRLGSWMETAIDSMYDLWDVTRGVAGVFEGLWKAAESAGSEGLDGFAKLMLRWKEVVNGADFQRGLTAVFKGSHAAMDSFGDAVRAIGRLFSDQSGGIERFIGSAGRFLAGIIEGAFDALNSPAFRRGLSDLSLGLDLGLEKILPSLQPIADTFGSFVGLLGDMASTVLPTATTVLENLTPSVDSIIGAARDVLPDLSDAISTAADVLGPALKGVVDALTPGLTTALKAFAKIAPPLAEAIARGLEAAGPILEKSAGAVGTQLSVFGVTAESIENGDSLITWAQNLRDEIQLLADSGDVLAEKISGLFDFARDLAGAFRDARDAVGEFLRNPIAASGDFVTSSGLGAFLASVPGLIRGYFEDAGTWLSDVGPRILNGLTTSLGSAVGTVIGFFFGLPERIRAAFTDAPRWLSDQGPLIMQGLANGVTGALGRVASAVGALPAILRLRLAGAGSWLVSIGKDLVKGLVAGINSVIGAIARALVGGVQSAISAAKKAAGINSPSKVTRQQLGRPLADGAVLGLRDRQKRMEAAARRLVSVDFGAQNGPTGAGAVTAPGGRVVNLNINHPVVRNLDQEALEAAEIAGVVL